MWQGFGWAEDRFVAGSAWRWLCAGLEDVLVSSIYWSWVQFVLKQALETPQLYNTCLSPCLAQSRRKSCGIQPVMVENPPLIWLSVFIAEMAIRLTFLGRWVVQYDLFLEVQHLPISSSHECDPQNNTKNPLSKLVYKTLVTAYLCTPRSLRPHPVCPARMREVRFICVSSASAATCLLNTQQVLPQP